jgi:arylsulfatase A-like enzyme
MTDDQGYGVSGTFGGVIPTPALDRVAKAGLRYTQFHSTALCSPTRAALITGRNHHSVGYGIIGELSTGYPGYDSIIGPENATIAEILKENGYATSWFGNTRTPVDDSYSVPFRFTGTINKLTFKLGPEQLTAADRKAATEAFARVND